jgi:probable phosphoglycerate mutase
MIPLLVIRHGETDWNAAGLMQGRADRHLSSAGRQKIERWRLPPGWDGAVCVASPLARAIETARLLRLQPRPEPRLVEMDWGEWEGRSLKDLRARLGDAMTENEARGLDFRPAGGESPRDVQERLHTMLADLAGPTIAITHKGVLRALYALASGWTMTSSPPVRLLDDCAHSFDVDQSGKPSIAELNIPLCAR